MTLFLVSTDYDKKTLKVVLRFYDDNSESYVYYSDEEYLPYCLALNEKELRSLHPNKISQVTIYDSLNDKNITMYKGEFRTANEVRALDTYVKKIAEDGEENPLWEYKLSPQMSNIYDKQIGMGMPYEFIEGKPVRLIDKDAESRVKSILEIFKDEDKDIIGDLTRLCEYPTPKFKRCAIDAEILSELHKFPLPEISAYPVVCVCIVTSDGRHIALVLKQPNKKFDKYPNVDELYIFGDETELLLKTFDIIKEYPIALTFNGDEFDFSYFKNRAHRLNIPLSKIPFYHYGKGVYIKGDTIHIDLYRFFNIQAIKNYAFQSKYKNVNLDEVSTALLDDKKLNQEHKSIGELSYYELVNYCMQDTDLTYRLSSFNDDLVMNLIMVISRISRLPIEESSRRAVGKWIGSFLFNLHRKLNYLIPRPEDIMKMKGGTTSNAKIKGKQFEAAIVFDTIQGIHFGAIVVDFSSLYPSIIKLQNIGYSTIRCTHNECQTNIPIPKLSHWVCTKNKSLEALFIGGLRDLRVQHYKQQPKRKDLPKPMISWYKCVEQVIKVFMNGSYGVFSTNNKNDTGKKPDELEQKNKFDGFAFLCPPASELIAGIARMTIIPTAEKAKSLGLVVLGGDTDSLFVLGDRAKVVELCEWAFKTFNIELALDKEPLFMGFSNRKKNYIMVFPDGKHDEKGLTGKKKHTPKFYKGYYERALTTMCDIKSEKDISIARKKMIKITKEGYNKIKEHRWDNLSDLAFHITVGKDIKSYTKTLPQHIKAVQMLEKAGYSFEIGSEVSFVKTLKGKRSNTEGVMPLEIIKNNNQVDVEKYIQLFKTMIEQLLDMFNIDWDSEILGYTKLF